MPQFPDSGFPGEIFAGEIDYSMEQLRKLDFLVGGMERFAEEGEFVVEADFWWSNLKHFLQAWCAKRNLTGIRANFVPRPREFFILSRNLDLI